MSMGLSLNLNAQPGFELHGKVILPDDDSGKPSYYQSLIKGVESSGLSLDKVLQLRNAPDLLVPGSGVDRALLFLFP